MELWLKILCAHSQADSQHLGIRRLKTPPSFKCWVPKDEGPQFTRLHLSLHPLCSRESSMRSETLRFPKLFKLLLPMPIHWSLPLKVLYPQLCGLCQACLSKARVHCLTVKYHLRAEGTAQCLACVKTRARYLATHTGVLVCCPERSFTLCLFKSNIYG